MRVPLLMAAGPHFYMHEKNLACRLSLVWIMYYTLFVTREISGSGEVRP